MVRTWISPTGEYFDVPDDELYTFCKQRGLHYENMLNHIEKQSSDQKNEGWRLIERLRAIGHVNRPRDHVLALGTLAAFHADCLASRDGRAVLTSRDNLGRLLKNRYKGGKPWNQWECRHLTSAEKRQLLETLAGEQQPLAAVEQAPAGDSLPDYGLPDFASGLTAFDVSGKNYDVSELYPPCLDKLYQAWFSKLTPLGS